MKPNLPTLLLAGTCLSTPAFAQGCGTQNPNCIVPTAPAGTSNNRAASTAFVQGAASGLNAISGLTGDVSASGPGSVSATIQPGAVTGSKIATGTVANSNLATMTVGTAKCRPYGAGSTGAPEDCVKDWVSVFDFGASGSNELTSGTISAASSTVNLASAMDFANGQGVRINHAGAAYAVGQVTSASVSVVGTSASTTYAYTISTVDAAGGIGAAIASFSTTHGSATLSSINYNHLTWFGTSSGTSTGYAVYGRASGSLTLLGITTNNQFNDEGQSAPVSPDWVPSSPPVISLPDWLLTTISSGGGTTTLTLANSATTTASSVTVAHEDSIAIQNAVNSLANANGGTVWLPAPTTQYNIGQCLTVSPGPAIALLGAGRGDDGTNGINGGTRLAAQGALSCMVFMGTSFVRGYRVSNLTLDGRAMAAYNIFVAEIDASSFDNLNLLNANTTNFVLGDGTHNTQENVLFTIRMDNSLNVNGQGAPGIVTLPLYNVQVNGVNNDLVSIKAANAGTANVYSASTAGSNKYVNVHGYDFFGGLAQAPTYNFLINGFGEQISEWEADGSATADVQVNGSLNTLLGGFAQFQGLTAEEGMAFGSSSTYNIASGNVVYNATTANSIVGGGTGNVWDGNVNGSTGATLGNPWSTYTASPSCSSASITTNSAHFKQRGKDTFIELDFSVSTLSSCTSSFSFGLPNTASTGAGLVGRDENSSAGLVGCSIGNGGTSAFCATASSMTSTSHIVLSGVYENQ